MTPEEINVAIAEVCGAKWFRLAQPENSRSLVMPEIVPKFLKPADMTEIILQVHYIPNYNGDLNAIHAAILTLNPDQQYNFGEQCRKLTKLTHPRGGHFTPNGFGIFTLATLSAPELCEVFLKTVGKWREEK